MSNNTSKDVALCYGSKGFQTSHLRTLTFLYWDLITRLIFGANSTAGRHPGLLRLREASATSGRRCQHPRHHSHCRHGRPRPHAAHTPHSVTLSLTMHTRMHARVRKGVVREKERETWGREAARRRESSRERVRKRDYR